VELLDIGGRLGFGSFELARKHRCHPVHGLLALGRDHRLMHPVLGSQLRQSEITLQRLQSHLGLEVCRIPLPRVRHRIVLSSGRYQLILLSEIRGPAQILCAVPKSGYEGDQAYRGQKAVIRAKAPLAQDRYHRRDCSSPVGSTIFSFLVADLRRLDQGRILPKNAWFLSPLTLLESRTKSHSIG
jgi:hypothetical protein